MLRTTLVFVGLAGALGTVGTTRADDKEVAAIDSATRGKLDKIAKDYADLGKVDERPNHPAVARVTNDHGGMRVAYTYAKDKDAYLKGRVAEGQYVVLETFDALRKPPSAAFTPGTKRDLYVMLRKELGTKDTDEGWVYATVSAEGEVTAGRIASCLDCHKHAANERLFGLDRKRKKGE